MIELRPGAERPSLAALEEQVRKHVPSTHVPVSYEIVPAMPRTTSLKIDVGTIRRQLADLRREKASA